MAQMKEWIRTPERELKEMDISNLWDNLKCLNMNIIGVPEGEKKEQDIGNLFERIMKENIPNLVKEIDMQVQEAQRVPNKMDAKRPTPRHIIIKIPKFKYKDCLLYTSDAADD